MAIAALLSVARTGVGDPQAGQTDNLDSITAVVLGGTSLFGGRGVILGTLIGAMIVGVFRNGLTLMGVQSVYQILITGILVILAVRPIRCRAGGCEGMSTPPFVMKRAGDQALRACHRAWTAWTSSCCPARSWR
jgi:hypothetical protein